MVFLGRNFFTFGIIMVVATIVATTVFADEKDLSKNGIELKVSTSSECVDTARDFEVEVKAVAPANTGVVLQDLRDRFQGFSV